MINKVNHIVFENTSIIKCLERLSVLDQSKQILFITDQDAQLKGCLSNGDVRRGLQNGLDSNSDLCKYYNPKVKALRNTSISKFVDLNSEPYRHCKLLPIVDHQKKIVEILDCNITRSILPVDVVIMAGGMGKRLHPYSLTKPKALLRVKNITLLEHVIDSFRNVKVKSFIFCVNHMASQIIEFLKDNLKDRINYKIVVEKEQMGTAGALSLLHEHSNSDCIVTNCDIISNINYKNLYHKGKLKNTNMVLVGVVKETKHAYGVVESNGDLVSKITEKPTTEIVYNSGVYYCNQKLIKTIPKQYLNMNDLVSNQIKKNPRSVKIAKHEGYWYDVGDVTTFKKLNHSSDIKVVGIK